MAHQDFLRSGRSDPTSATRESTSIASFLCNGSAHGAPKTAGALQRAAPRRPLGTVQSPKRWFLYGPTAVGRQVQAELLRTTYVIVRLAIQHARSTNDSHTKEPAKFALDFASCSSSTFQNNTVVGHFAPRHNISPLIYGSTPHLRSSAVASIVIDIDHIYLSIRSCTNVRQQRKCRAILPVAVRDFWGF